MSDSQAKSSSEELISIAKGTVLMAEGESPSYLYLVKSGLIKTFKKEGHKLTTVGTIRGKGLLGELSVFTENERSMSAIAIEDSEVYMIKRTEINKVLADCPKWIESIMHTISKRLLHSREMLIEHSIINDLYDNDVELSIEEEKRYIKSIDDYCENKGI